MRLSSETLPQLSSAALRPNYDYAEQRCGIVHFGIGAFHRAHQTVYTDDAMNAGDRDWRIIGVSLRSPAVASQLNPQDGLYALAERSSSPMRARVIGAVRDVVVAAQSRARLAISLIAPSTRIVSFTVTEKGYCRAPDGSLDFALANEASFYPHLADAFSERRAAGIGGLTLLSCDNLARNGTQLSALVAEYLDRHDPTLRAWFERECACPSTMVDRIVPATTDADRADVEAAIGLSDEAAVVTEPFSQWVIEDRFAGARPRWEIGGAQFTHDVHAFETAKLRMLNGAHSALAYLGLARGHVFVHQAIADPELALLINRLMRREAAPTVEPAPGQDLDAYADALLARFHNPALNHRLAQIAMDGSQKIPQRWLETLAWHQARGAHCDAILSALAAWLIFVRGNSGSIEDPLAEALSAAWTRAGTPGIIDAVLALLPSPWRPNDHDRRFVQARLSRS